MKLKSYLPSLIAESGLVDENGAQVGFNHNLTTLDMDAFALANFTEDNLCVGKDDIVGALEALNTLDADQIHNAQYTKAYRELADDLAIHLSKAITNLRGVQKDVDEAMKEFSYFRAHAISMNPILSKSVEGHEDIPLNMKKLDWHQLNDVDVYVVLARVNNKLEQDTHAVPSMENYDRLLNMLPFANKFNSVDFSKLNLSDEAYQQILNALQQNSGLDHDAACGVINTLNSFNPQYCKAAITFCNDLCHTGADKLEKALDMVAVWNKAIPVLSSQELLDVSNSTMSAIMQRVNCVTDIIDFLAYTCVDYRQNRWNKALVVDGPMINSDNFAEFEQAGGTVSQICKYVNYFHKDIRIPNAGISNEHLFNEFHRVEEAIDKEIADKQISVTDQLKDIERNAFNIAAHNWIHKHAEHFVRMTKDDINHFVNIINDGTESMDGKFYQLILNSQYHNSDTQKLYNELSAEYAKHVEDFKTLSEEDIAAIDCQVYSRLLSEKLLDSGILE